MLYFYLPNHNEVISKQLSILELPWVAHSPYISEYTVPFFSFPLFTGFPVSTYSTFYRLSLLWKKQREPLPENMSSSLIVLSASGLAAAAAMKWCSATNTQALWVTQVHLPASFSFMFTALQLIENSLSAPQNWHLSQGPLSCNSCFHYTNCPHILMQICLLTCSAFKQSSSIFIQSV